MARRRMVNERIVKDVAVVKFTSSKILEGYARAACRELDIIFKSGWRKIIIDFSDVIHFSFDALSPLISFIKMVGSNGGQVVVCGLFGQPKELFERIKSVNMAENVREALQMLE